MRVKKWILLTILLLSSFWGFSLFSSIKYFDFNSRQPKIRLLDDAPQRHFKFSSSFCHLQKSSFIEFWSSWFLETDNYKLNWVRSRNVFQFQSENLILAGQNPVYHNFQVKLAINLDFLEKCIFDSIFPVHLVLSGALQKCYCCCKSNDSMKLSEI